MPQMAPIMWLFMFLFFMTLLMLLKSNIFFFDKNIMSTLTSFTFKKKNWKF